MDRGFGYEICSSQRWEFVFAALPGAGDGNFAGSAAALASPVTHLLSSLALQPLPAGLLSVFDPITRH